MATRIPSRNELYYDYKKGFFAKSRFNKKFKIGMVIGLFIGFLIPASATYNKTKEFYDDNIISKIPSEEVALISYVEKMNPQKGLDIALATIKWAKHYEVDPKLILAVQTVESKFDIHAISSSGAMGLMQIIPKWHLEKIKQAKIDVGTPELFNVDSNIYIGTWVLKECMSKFKFADALEVCYSGGHVGYANSVITNYNFIKKFVKESI